MIICFAIQLTVTLYEGTSKVGKRIRAGNCEFGRCFRVFGRVKRWIFEICCDGSKEVVLFFADGCDANGRAMSIGQLSTFVRYPSTQGSENVGALGMVKY